ncbi:hypothetical protein SmaMPs15_000077 [Stenotrophomonas maltophilia phage vB_SmaM_Ps15]|uniref:Uncharacterized protein n=1 Tax=Stenotrophomonas maltophilia phage vB_SmaM_Ps15 TaxID=3071007 RepID=A0AAE9FHA6_9CAUD|nr:hypothetical protein PQC01_gp077 [Stenotrophomonas maltophilia phage vB_SmaM_Ps15]UMO77228.1 hypothetical protein SmaMPs15_000077 [Stenotrophomonas maltophilia phage vB_SmaM_Ps15]
MLIALNAEQIAAVMVADQALGLIILGSIVATSEDGVADVILPPEFVSLVTLILAYTK